MVSKNTAFYVMTGQQKLYRPFESLMCIFKNKPAKRVGFKVTQDFSKAMGTVLEGSFKVKKNLSLFGNVSMSNFDFDPRSLSFGVKFKNPRHFAGTLAFLLTNDMLFGFKFGYPFSSQPLDSFLMNCDVKCLSL